MDTCTFCGEAILPITATIRTAVVSLIKIDDKRKRVIVECSRCFLKHEALNAS